MSTPSPGSPESPWSPSASPSSSTFEGRFARGELEVDSARLSSAEEMPVLPSSVASAASAPTASPASASPSSIEFTPPLSRRRDTPLTLAISLKSPNMSPALPPLAPSAAPVTPPSTPVPPATGAPAFARVPSTAPSLTSSSEEQFCRANTFAGGARSRLTLQRVFSGPRKLSKCHTGGVESLSL